MPPEVIFNSTACVFWTTGFLPLAIHYRRYQWILLTGALITWIDMQFKMDEMGLLDNFLDSCIDMMLYLAGGLIMYMLVKRTYLS